MPFRCMKTRSTFLRHHRSEIRNAIQHMKRGKVADIDELTGEMSKGRRKLLIGSLIEHQQIPEVPAHSKKCNLKKQ